MTWGDLGVFISKFGSIVGPKLCSMFCVYCFTLYLLTLYCYVCAFFFCVCCCCFLSFFSSLVDKNYLGKIIICFPNTLSKLMRYVSLIGREPKGTRTTTKKNQHVCNFIKREEEEKKHRPKKEWKKRHICDI